MAQVLYMKQLQQVIKNHHFCITAAPKVVTNLHVLCGKLRYLRMFEEHSSFKLHSPLGGAHVSRQQLRQLLFQEARSMHPRVVVAIGNLGQREGTKKS